MRQHADRRDVPHAGPVLPNRTKSENRVTNHPDAHLVMRLWVTSAQIRCRGDAGAKDKETSN